MKKEWTIDTERWKMQVEDPFGGEKNSRYRYVMHSRQCGKTFTYKGRFDPKMVSITGYMQVPSVGLVYKGRVRFGQFESEVVYAHAPKGDRLTWTSLDLIWR